MKALRPAAALKLLMSSQTPQYRRLAPCISERRCAKQLPQHGNSATLESYCLELTVLGKV